MINRVIEGSKGKHNCWKGSPSLQKSNGRTHVWELEIYVDARVRNERST